MDNLFPAVIQVPKSEIDRYEKERQRTQGKKWKKAALRNLNVIGILNNLKNGSGLSWSYSGWEIGRGIPLTAALVLKPIQLGLIDSSQEDGD